MKLTQIQQDWLAALRSGKYKQGRYALFTSEGDCCLGVAARVVALPGWEMLAPSADLYLTGFTPAGSLTKGDGVQWKKSLPKEYVTALGLRNDSGSPDGQKAWDNGIGLSSLVTYNDFNEWSFAKIADHLEKYAEYYFINPETEDESVQADEGQGNLA